MLERSPPAFEDGFVSVTYTGERGDELPLHRHGFNHTMQVVSGEVDAFSATGRTTRRAPDDRPLEFPAGVRHGVRCVTAAVFVNRSPTLGYLAENA